MFILRSETKKAWNAREDNDGERFGMNSVYGFMNIKLPPLTGLGKGIKMISASRHSIT